MKVVAVEPKTSAVLSTGVAGPHKIQGIGAGFVPDVLDTRVYDEIIPVANEDAFATGKADRPQARACWWAFPPALPSGPPSSWPSVRKTQGKTIVVLLPDTGDRYLSTPLFAD